MDRLSALPNEILIQIFSASSTTRTMWRLAHVNKRLYTIWLAHSDQIITNVYHRKIQHFQDAVDFTTSEQRLAMSGPEHKPLRQYLPKILRNIGLATKICCSLSAFIHSVPVEEPYRQQVRTPLPAAYFLVRRAVLAYFLPELRPGLISTLRGVSIDTLQTSVDVRRFCLDMTEYSLKVELGCIRTEEELGQVPEDEQSRPPDCWCYAERLFVSAVYEKEEGITGRMEACWDTPILDLADLYASSWDSSSDVDEYEDEATDLE